MTAITDSTAIDRIITNEPEQLAGFTIRTIDGEAGVVAGHQERVDNDHLVVHVGTRLFGSDVVLEADTVTEIDLESGLITVNRVSEWVKESPKAGRSRA